MAERRGRGRGRGRGGRGRGGREPREFREKVVRDPKHFSNVGDVRYFIKESMRPIIAGVTESFNDHFAKQNEGQLWPVAAVITGGEAINFYFDITDDNALKTYDYDLKFICPASGVRSLPKDHPFTIMNDAKYSEYKDLPEHEKKKMEAAQDILVGFRDKYINLLFGALSEYYDEGTFKRYMESRGVTMPEENFFVQLPSDDQIQDKKYNPLHRFAIRYHFKFQGKDQSWKDKANNLLDASPYTITTERSAWLPKIPPVSKIGNEGVKDLITNNMDTFEQYFPMLLTTYVAGDDGMYYVPIGYVLWEIILLIERTRKQFHKDERIGNKMHRRASRYKAILTSLMVPETKLKCRGLPGYNKKCRAQDPDVCKHKGETISLETIRQKLLDTGLFKPSFINKASSADLCETYKII